MSPSMLPVRTQETKLFRQLTQGKKKSLQSQSGQRRALLIGCQEYHNFPRLEHALDDVDDLAECLEGLKFKVRVCKDVTRTAAKRIIAEFSFGIGQKDVTIFYFAGHGTQVAGRNWLATVDSTLEDRGLDMELHVMDQLVSHNFRHSVVMMFDACRSDIAAINSNGTETKSRQLPQPDGGELWNGCQLAEFKGASIEHIPDIHMLYSLDPAEDHSRELQNGVVTTGIMMHIGQRRISIQQCLSQVWKSAEFFTKKSIRLWQATHTMSNAQPLPVCLAGGNVAAEIKKEKSRKTIRKSSLPSMKIALDNGPVVEEEDPIFSVAIDEFLQERVELSREDMQSLTRTGFTTIHTLRVALPMHLTIAGLSERQKGLYVNHVPQFCAAVLGSPSQHQELKHHTRVLALIKTGNVDLVTLQLHLRAFRQDGQIVQAVGERMIALLKRKSTLLPDQGKGAPDTLKQLEVARLGVLMDTQAAMAANIKVDVVQTRMCQLIRAIVKDSQENQIIASQIRLLKNLRATLQEHTHALAVIVRCCQAILALISGHDENQKLLVQLGMLADLESLLVIHVADERITLLICSILRISVHWVHNLYSNEDNNKTLDEEELITELLRNICAALGYVMGEYITNAEIVTNALVALRSLVATERTEDIAYRLNMLEYVLRAMRYHVDDPNVQEHACWAISNLASNMSESRAKGHELGILDAIQVAMQAHPDCAPVQYQAVWALLNMTHNAPTIQADAAKQGVLTTINEAMHNPNIKLGTTMPEACWALIRNITHNSKAAQIQAGRIGLTKWQQSSLKEQHKFSSAVEQVCWSIKNISTATDLSPGRAQLLLDQLHEIMVEWKSSPVVQEQACSALWSLAVVTSSMTELGLQMAGFVAALKEAMENHGVHPGVVVQACWALSNLCRAWGKAKMESVHRNLVERLDAVLKLHAANEAVSEAACVSLRSILQGQNPKMVATFLHKRVEVREGHLVVVMSNVLNAMIANQSAKNVVENGSWILKLLTNVNITEGIEKVTEVMFEQLMRLKEVMRKQMDSTEVQEHLCSVLWNLSISRRLEDGVGPTTQMKNIIGGFGFLSEIQMAMRTHRSNVTVQTAAIGALECLTNNCPKNQGAAVSLHLVVEIMGAVSRHGAVSNIQSHAPILLERLSRNVNVEHGRAAQYLSRQPSKPSSVGARSEKSFKSRFDAPDFDEASFKSRLASRSKPSFKERGESSPERALSRADSSKSLRSESPEKEGAPPTAGSETSFKNRFNRARGQTGSSKRGDEGAEALGAIDENSTQKTGADPASSVDIPHSSVSNVQAKHKLRRAPSRRPTMSLLTYMPPEPSLLDKRAKSAGTVEGVENSRGENTDVAFLTRIANARDIVYIQQMLRAHRMDMYVQHACLAAISNCICNDLQNLQIARDKEILEDVMNAMVTHDSVGSIQEAACRAIKYLVAGGAMLSGKEDCMPAIALALRDFKEVIPVIVQCYLALVNLVEGDESSKIRCLRFGLLRTICMTIRVMGFSASVVESSMKLLHELTTSSVIKRLEQTFKEIHDLGLIREVEIVALNHRNSVNINNMAFHLQKLGRRHGLRTTTGNGEQGGMPDGGTGQTPRATGKGEAPEEPSGSSQTPQTTADEVPDWGISDDGGQAAIPRRLPPKKRRSTVSRKKVKKPAVA